MSDQLSDMHCAWQIEVNNAEEYLFDRQIFERMDEFGLPPDAITIRPVPVGARARLHVCLCFCNRLVVLLRISA